MLHWIRRSAVRAQLPPGERVYAIGDVHGEAALLTALLVQIERDTRARGQARTTLVLLGDVIDRGPKAAELLMALHRMSNPACVLLKGNHEAMMVAAYRGNEDALDLWLKVGGRSTLTGFGIDAAAIHGAALVDLIKAMRLRIDPALIEWVDALPTAWSSGGYFFTHAGIRPGVPLDRQHDDDLLWIRAPFLVSRADHGKVVVHGHTVEPGTPRLGGTRIGLDTGAHEHRRLTALGLEDDRQWLLQADESAVTTGAGLREIAMAEMTA